MISAETGVTNVDIPLPSFDFRKESGQLLSLVESWTDEEKKTKTRRELRENKKSVYEERQKKTILEDETIIPDRTINSNIRRSKVSYTNYITQSKRLLIITDTQSPQISIEPLEMWFTRGMRYPDWKDPWFELVDAVHVHGGAAMEVVYDPSKPLNCTLEFIPRDALIYPLKTRNLQNCPRILRCYEITPIQLEQFIEDYNFDQKVAKDLFDKFHKDSDYVKIYRVLMKVKGVVFNAWWSKDVNTDWLRAPMQHDVGLIDFNPAIIQSPVALPEQSLMGQPMGQPMGPMNPSIPLYLSPEWEQARMSLYKPLPLKAYPIFWYPFQKVENQNILEVQGRASMDLHVQEAMTHLLTNTVNATTRASNFYPCAESQPGDDPKLIELGPLKPGVVMSRQLTFNQLPWPNNIILSVMQALKVGKADESGQTDYAATARKDANKTAKELELATEQANTVITSDMDVFSSPFLSTLALCFNIACHQSIFNLCKRPNRPDLLVGDYNLQPAGDIEVVKRAEDKANAKEFFNIVQGTPTAEKILVFLIQRFFPDQADEWIETLKTPDLRPLVIQLVSILEQAPLDGLTPEQQSGIGNLIATARELVGQPNNNPLSRGASPSQGKSAPQSNAVQQTG